MDRTTELVIINNFELYKPTTKPHTEEIKNLYDGKAEAFINYPPPKVTSVVSHFPVILCNEIPWDYSTRYLLDKVQDYSNPQPSTLVSIARDLRDFKRWVDEEEIDYLSCKKKIKSPIRKYRNYLSTTDLSPNVISRKLSRVVAFYRYLQENENIIFEASLWEEKEARILIQSHSGQSFLKKVTTTDVQQVAGKNKNTNKGFDGVIIDGGELTPLSMDQQKILFQSLKNIGNTEMTLSFLIALCTGARIQSVFTLRKIHFRYDPLPDQKEVIIYAGSWAPNQIIPNDNMGTTYARDIDTKNGKRLKIYFPTWLYKKVQTYINSERAKKRYDNPAHQFVDPDRQYVFLTTRKKPFYSAKNDNLTATYLNPPTGASVQQFISAQLKPELKRQGFHEHFKFHNLRASYGMNIVRSRLPFIGKKGHLSLGELLQFVKVRMGHNSLKTTELYLDFDNKQKLVQEVQLDYENYLKSMVSVEGII